MPAKLEPLNIRIVGSAQGLSATLGKTQREIKSFGDQIRERLSKINPAALAGGIAVGVGAALASAAVAASEAIQEVGEQWAELQDELGRAEQIGVAVDELRGLQLAIAETSRLDFDGAFDGVRTLVQTLAESANNLKGEVAQTLIGLQLDPVELVKDPTDALVQLSQAFQRIQDPAERLRIATKLFGEEASSAVSTLQAGPAAIQSAIAFSKQWGGELEVNARLVQEAQASIGRISFAIDSIAKTFAAEVAPAVSLVTDEILAASGGLEGWQQYSQAFGEGLVYITGELRDMAALAKSIATLDLEGITEALTADTGTANIRQLLEDRAKVKFDLDFEDAKRQVANLKLDAPELPKLEETAKKVADASSEWERAADRFRSSLATPREQFDSYVEQLRQAVEQGGLELEVYQRGVEQAALKLQEALRPSERAGVIFEGSAAEADLDAYEFLAREQRQRAQEIVSKIEPPKPRAKENIEQQGQQQQEKDSETAKVMKEILEELKGQRGEQLDSIVQRLKALVELERDGGTPPPLDL